MSEWPPSDLFPVRKGWAIQAFENFVNDTYVIRVWKPADPARQYECALTREELEDRTGMFQQVTKFLESVGALAYPSHGLPPGAVQLPVYPFDPTRPDNTLPTQPGVPTNPIAPGGERPSGQPIVPGAKFVVKWLACHGLILVPDNSLPPTAEPKA